MGFSGNADWQNAVETVLSYDLAELCRRDPVARTELWNRLQSDQRTFERDFLPKLAKERREEVASRFALARLLLATAACTNQEDSPIISEFPERDMTLIGTFEKFSVFDILTPEEIAERIRRRGDVRKLVVDFRQQYADVDRILESAASKNLRTAFWHRYRERLNKINRGVEAYVRKYGWEDLVAPAGEREATPAPKYGGENAPIAGKSQSFIDNDNRRKVKVMTLRRFNTLVVPIIMLILIFVGWQLYPWLKEYFNTPASTGRSELLIHSIPGDGGSIISSPLPESDGKYKAGTRVTLEARPAPGYSFYRWSGDAQGTMNPTVVTMDRDKNINAEFIR